MQANSHDSHDSNSDNCDHALNSTLFFGFWNFLVGMCLCICNERCIRGPSKLQAATLQYATSLQAYETTRPSVECRSHKNWSYVKFRLLSSSLISNQSKAANQHWFILVRRLNTSLSCVARWQAAVKGYMQAPSKLVPYDTKRSELDMLLHVLDWAQVSSVRAGRRKRREATRGSRQL